MVGHSILRIQMVRHLITISSQLVSITCNLTSLHDKSTPIERLCTAAKIWQKCPNVSWRSLGEHVVSLPAGQRTKWPPKFITSSPNGTSRPLRLKQLSRPSTQQHVEFRLHTINSTATTSTRQIFTTGIHNVNFNVIYWRSKLLISLLEDIVNNAWVLSTESRETTLHGFRDDLAKKLMQIK